MKEDVQKLKAQEKENFFPDRLVVTESDLNATKKKQKFSDDSAEQRRERLSDSSRVRVEQSADTKPFPWLLWLIVFLALDAVLLANTLPLWAFAALVPAIAKLRSAWQARHVDGEFSSATRQEWNFGVVLMTAGIFLLIGAPLGFTIVQFILFGLIAILVSNYKL